MVSKGCVAKTGFVRSCVALAGVSPFFRSAPQFPAGLDPFLWFHRGVGTLLRLSIINSTTHKNRGPVNASPFSLTFVLFPFPKGDGDWWTGCIFFCCDYFFE